MKNDAVLQSKETELKAKLYDAVERWYDSLDNLAKKLQDDISGEKQFKQSEGDRAGLCFVLDYMDDLKKEIKNVGNLSAKEVSQLYVKDECSFVVRPEKELKGYSKDLIKPGEERQVKIKLCKRAFAYYSTV